VNRSILVNPKRVTSWLLLRCVKCGRTDMALIRGLFSEGGTCCGQDMSESLVPDRVVCVWNEERVTVVEHGLVARRVPGGNFRVYRNGEECGRFFDPNRVCPDECRVTVFGVPGEAECRYRVEGIVMAHDEERLT